MRNVRPLTGMIMVMAIIAIMTTLIMPQLAKYRLSATASNLTNAAGKYMHAVSVRWQTGELTTLAEIDELWSHEEFRKHFAPRGSGIDKAVLSQGEMELAVDMKNQEPLVLIVTPKVKRTGELLWFFSGNCVADGTCKGLIK